MTGTPPPEGTVRAIVVGAGLMGRWHAHAARRAGGRVVAVVDPDERRGRALAGRCGGAAWHPTAGAAAAGSPADVAHVCTPLETHVPLSSELLRAGLDVLVEKPMAADEAETAVLLALAREHGRMVCPVLQWPFQRGIARIVSERSRRGDPVHLEVTICSAGADHLDDAGRDRIALEILPHPLSVMDVLLPGGVAAAPWRARRTGPGELRVETEVDGAGRATSVAVLVSMNARPTQATVVARFPYATLCADMFHGYGWTESVATSRSGKTARPFAVALRQAAGAAGNLARRAVTREWAYPGLTELTAAFYRARAPGAEAPVPAARALAVARVGDHVASLAARTLG